MKCTDKWLSLYYIHKHSLLKSLSVSFNFCRRHIMHQQRFGSGTNHSGYASLNLRLILLFNKENLPHPHTQKCDTNGLFYLSLPQETPRDKYSHWRPVVVELQGQVACIPVHEDHPVQYRIHITKS